MVYGRKHTLCMYTMDICHKQSAVEAYLCFVLKNNRLFGVENKKYKKRSIVLNKYGVGSYTYYHDTFKLEFELRKV